jgi:hypothetical protein
MVVRVDATTTRLGVGATPTQLEANFRYARNVAGATGRVYSVVFWDASTDPREPRWWVRTYYPDGTWGEDTLEGHQSGSLAGRPPPTFAPRGGPDSPLPGLVGSVFTGGAEREAADGPGQWLAYGLR